MNSSRLRSTVGARGQSPEARGALNNPHVPRSPGLATKFTNSTTTAPRKKKTMAGSPLKKGRPGPGYLSSTAPPLGVSKLLAVEGKRASITSSPSSRRGSSQAATPVRGSSQPQSLSPQPPAQSRPVNHPRQKAATPPPSHGATYMVGTAVLNPNLPIAPSVQSAVREVSLGHDPLAPPARPPVGAVLRDAASTPEVQQSPTREGDPPSLPYFLPTAKSTAATTLITEISSKEKSAPQCVEVLRERYGTTAHDTVPEEGLEEMFANAVPRAYAREILPSLLHAEERAEELASIRRLIDWTVSIPTPETVPPPSITFLSEQGKPVPQVTSVVYTLDTATGTLSLTSVSSKETTKEEVDHFGSCRMNKTLPASSGKGELLETKTVGATVDKMNDVGLYRIRKVVGLLPGLAEKVGLERVLEFVVTTPTREMFLSAPYVDAEEGDVVVHLNLGLEGAVRFDVKGVDCGSVDPLTGQLQESSNTLHCVIQVKTALGGRGGRDVGGRSRTFSNSAAATSPTKKKSARPQEKGPFSFPLDNPHTLLYEELSQTNTEFLLKKRYKLKKTSELRQKKSHKAKSERVDLEGSVLSDAAEEMTPAVLQQAVKTAQEKEEETEKENVEFRTQASNSPWFSLGSLQLPIGHFRLSAWQHRFTELFTSTGNQELFRTDVRLEVKKSAKRDLRDLLNAMGSSKGVGNSGSMSRRRSSTKRSSLQADSLLIHSTAEGENANAKNNEKIRQLILCLLLEENKNSRQLYSDITQLCDVYVTSAYSRTSSISGGTRDHLQRKAATLLVPADNGSSPLQVPGSPRGKLNGQSREEINILLDALELAMVATFTIGCFSHCSQYALQRVHGMCVREQDTTAYFNSAQRDLAEVYLFYGDGKSATMVAEDVLSLAERIHGPNSPEAVEATLLLALASISCTEGKRAAEVLPPLHEAVQKGEVTLPAHLQAQIHIAVAYTRPNIGSHQLDRHGLTTDSVVAELNRAHALLRGDGDLAEMDKSFSTVLPSQINNSNNASVNAAEDVLHKAQKSREEKRLRWNLLSLVGSMLIQNGQVQKGIAIIEDVVQELVLGQHRPMERRSRSEMASIMWVSVALWRCWAYPTEVHNTEVMVRRMVQRLLTVKGPMHPLASLAHLMFAFLLRTKPHGGSLNMTTKSIQHMQKTLYARSPLLQYAYRVGCVLNTLSHRWKHAIDHANAALQVATANGCYDETLTIHEQDLMGCLLLTPNTVTVTILREELSQQLEGRIASLAKGYGANHARLVTPLLNWSEFLYLQGKYEAAFEHAQRAVRIADPKGLLYVTGKILLPGTLLPKSSLQQRNHLVLSVLQTPHQVFQLVQVLYFNAAIQVALGKTSDALDGYLRCLALLECVELEGCLSSIYIMRSVARLFYTSGEYGDALGWAATAAEDTRRHYGSWPLEALESKTLLSVIEERLLEEEGSYVIINHQRPVYDSNEREPAAGDFVELL